MLSMALEQMTICDTFFFLAQNYFLLYGLILILAVPFLSIYCY